MSVISKLDRLAKEQLYELFDLNDIINFAEGSHDINYLYAVRLMQKKNIPMECLYEEQSEEVYHKLYMECPYLADFPHFNNVIVAGGFINIALDSSLKYSDFPTSDIDIFICNENMHETLGNVLKFFDSLGAKYKEYSKIVNVYLPNYHRNFQIICIKHKTVSNVISYFHSSHVKCGLHNGIIKMTPDCICSYRNKIAILDRRNLNAYTLLKLIKRGYTPLGLEHIRADELLSYKSVTHRKDLEQQIEEKEYVTSEELLERIKYPCNFARYRTSCDCSEEHEMSKCRFAGLRYSQNMSIVHIKPVDVRMVHSGGNTNGRFQTNRVSVTCMSHIENIPFLYSHWCSNIVLPEMKGKIINMNPHDPIDQNTAKFTFVPDELHYESLVELKTKLLNFCNTVCGTQFTGVHSNNMMQFNDMYRDRIDSSYDGKKRYIKCVKNDNNVDIMPKNVHGICTLSASLYIITKPNEQNISNITVPPNMYARPYGYYWGYNVAKWIPDVREVDLPQVSSAPDHAHDDYHFEDDEVDVDEDIPDVQQKLGHMNLTD